MLVLGLAGGGVLLVGGVVLALVLSGIFRDKPAPSVTADKQVAAKPKVKPEADKTPVSNQETAKPTDKTGKVNDTPAAAPAVAALREQLLGKWEGQDETGKGNFEFLANGDMMLVMEGGPPIKGSYRILDGQTVEVRLPLGEQVLTQKLRVKAGKDELTTTDEMNKVEHFHRGTDVALRPPEKARPSEPSRPSEAKPAVSLTAEQLAGEYQNDRAMAEKKYNGKLLAVEGIVHLNMISHPLFGIEVKGLSKPGDKVRLVACYLRKDLEGKIKSSEVKLDQKIRLKGRCKGLDELDQVVLTDCEIMRAPTPSLAKEDKPKPAENPGAAPRGDLKALQGTWTAIQGAAGGKTVQAAIAKHFKGRLVLTGDKYVLTATETGEAEEGTIKLDETATPKRIDLRVSKGRDKGKELPGIYSFDGEVLKLCVARPKADRPAAFETFAQDEDDPWILLFARASQPAEK